VRMISISWMAALYKYAATSGLMEQGFDYQIISTKYF